MPTSPLLISTGSTAERRAFFRNVNDLIRATKGKNLVFTSGALDALHLRGPYDIANLYADGRGGGGVVGASDDVDRRVLAISDVVSPSAAIDLLRRSRP